MYARQREAEARVAFILGGRRIIKKKNCDFYPLDPPVSD
jgi:hypothetical protein